MANSKPGVVIYFETGKAIKGLDYETKGRLFEAIMEYAEFGVVPDFDGILSAVWPFVADKIDRDSAKYEEVRQTRAKAGRKGGLARASKSKQKEANEANATFDKQIKPTETASETVTETASENETNDIKADKPPRPRFIPPTVEEVAEYCKERNNKVDPDKFVAYYTSNGWMVGKNKMKDWKAAVHTWELSEYNKTKEGSNGRVKEDSKGNGTFIPKEIVL